MSKFALSAWPGPVGSGKTALVSEAPSPGLAGMRGCSWQIGHHTTIYTRRIAQFLTAASLVHWKPERIPGGVRKPAACPHTRHQGRLSITRAAVERRSKQQFPDHGSWCCVESWRRQSGGQLQAPNCPWISAIIVISGSRCEKNPRAQGRSWHLPAHPLVINKNRSCLHGGRNLEVSGNGDTEAHAWRVDPWCFTKLAQWRGGRATVEAFLWPPNYRNPS